ncbi:MAG: CBS domain-containing protein [Deltaproteobacteria bacterium]|nr:CBS domain-containing protein [Deltaproteobacteria bacterium]
MSKLPVVRDFMDKVVPTLKPDAPMLEAVDFLLKNHVTGAPVVNDAGEMVGMVTEKDCLRLLSTGVDGDYPRGTVKEFMTTKVDYVAPNMNVYFVAGMFLQASFRRFPVLENGKLVGAITRFDILRAIQAGLKSAG